MEENTGMGWANCGGKRERKRCLVWCVAGCGGAPVNKEKKRQGNGKGALISRMIIKRRDPLKRPISN